MSECVSELNNVMASKDVYVHAHIHPLLFEQDDVLKFGYKALHFH